jgi:signal transduction histidine kinase
LGESGIQTDPRLLYSASQSLVDGLVLIDAEGIVAFWNLRAEEFLRLPATEMLGQHADVLIARMAERTTSPDTMRPQLQNAFSSRDAHSRVEMEIASEPMSGDHALTLEAQFFLLCDLGGCDIGVGLLLHDITRERIADEMKSQLLSTVSHELRTPLASIKGFATTLLRQDVKWDEANQRDFLHIIEEEADRLTEIIDNLLDMSQIEAGALRVAKEPTQLRKLIRRVVDEMRMRTEAHYFVVDLPAELKRVEVDSRRIRQVLVNLIGNAIKYSKGGQITVACELEGDHVLVSVSDQGEGIAPQFVNKIFERFFQVNGASTRRVGGSGLGLAISRGIIEAHNGKIWVESVPGQGSTFRFTLPLADSEAAE